MNVKAMIRRLGGRYYPVSRAAVDGVWSQTGATAGAFVPGATTELRVFASVQPLDYAELISIPEGDRATERFRFYSEQPLNLQDTGRLRKGDRVDVGDGVLFEVEKVAHWPNHAKAVIVKVNTDGN